MERLDLSWDKAEGVVLGTILQNRHAIVDVADRLKPEHFADTQHAADYSAMLDMWTGGGVVDLLTAPYHVSRRTGEPIATAATRLVGYSGHVSNSVHLHAHVAILIDLWKRRRILEITGKLAMSGGDDTDELRGELAKLMSDTAEDSGYAEDTLTALSYDFHNTEAPEAPIPWGITGVDGCAAAKGTVTVLGGRPGAGKSAFALNMAMNLAERTKVWFVSLEMPKEDVTARCDAMASGLNLGDVLTRRLSDPDMATLAAGIARHQHARNNLVVNFVGHISTVDFMAQAARKVQRDGVGLIVVDYMQIMTADNRQFKTEYDRVTEISRVLRRTARELNCPILALSQLRRREGGGEVPTMADLRSSGQIEQDAHVILLLHRAEENEIAVTCVKNRNGRPFEAKVWCDLSCGRIGGKPGGWDPPHPDNWTEPNF